jgi:hypothetical protein
MFVQGGAEISQDPAPSPSLTFEGLDYANWGTGHPPNVSGDAGPTYYIQAVNSSIGIYRKSDGIREAAFTLNTFMSQGNFGNLCDTDNMGDAVVLYDSFEDRWIITDAAYQLSNGIVMEPPEPKQCIAVSKSGNPLTGGWNFYSISPPLIGAPTKARFGIWPNGLYMSAQIKSFYIPEIARVWAFNKLQMYAGAQDVQMVTFEGAFNESHFLPSNARLETGTPPENSPNYFTTAFYADGISVRKLSVDWSSPGAATFSPIEHSFTGSAAPAAPATVPSPANNLATMQGQLMMQNQYTNIGGVESLWNAHSVQGTASANAAPRYYQTVVTDGTVSGTLAQASTFNPDASAVNRFLPSVAVNRLGDMAMGYSASSASLIPRFGTREGWRAIQRTPSA